MWIFDVANFGVWREGAEGDVVIVTPSTLYAISELMRGVKDAFAYMFPIPPPPSGAGVGESVKMCARIGRGRKCGNYELLK